MIPHEYIEELTRRTDIVELVGSYVQLKRKGRLYGGLCPFHSEKSPSFYVYPDTQSFYCFGCGAGGDAITFAKKINSIDYPEAVKMLAARAGMPEPQEYGELNHCRQTPCRASSANDGPHPCHARTRRAIHHHCPQSRSTAAIAPCVPLLQPGTNRLSHNSGSSSLGVGAIPTAILGFEGLICADVMKREDLSQSRVMTQPPFRWICHAVMMTAEPEHGKSRMLHRPAGHGQP